MAKPPESVMRTLNDSSNERSFATSRVASDPSVTLILTVSSFDPPVIVGSFSIFIVRTGSTNPAVSDNPAFKFTKSTSRVPKLATPPLIATSTSFRLASVVVPFT